MLSADYVSRTPFSLKAQGAERSHATHIPFERLDKDNAVSIFPDFDFVSG